MSGNLERRAAWRRFKRKLLYVFDMTVALLGFAASATALALTFSLFCPDCALPNSLLMFINGAGAILFFVLGIFTLWITCKKTGNAQVVISEIPTADLEKSPAPTLPYSHIPRHQLLVEASSCCSSLVSSDCITTVQSNLNEVQTSLRDLPSYITAVQNTFEIYSSMEVGLWTEDAPKTPPPCYEQALGMTPLAGTASAILC